MSTITQQNPVRLFVNHVFESNDDYLRVFEYLESAHNFYYKNCSIVEPHPGDEQNAIRTELRRQIALSEVVVIFAVLYKPYRDLIEFQLRCARELKKPVILMEYYGVNAKLPVQLEVLANEVVKWNERDLVDAIRRLARNEESTRWEVIDFKPE